MAVLVDEADGVPAREAVAVLGQRIIGKFEVAAGIPSDVLLQEPAVIGLVPPCADLDRTRPGVEPLVVEPERRLRAPRSSRACAGGSGKSSNSYADGLRTEQIAELLFLSAHTVRAHVKSALRTLGVHKRAEAVTLVHTDQTTQLP